MAEKTLFVIVGPTAIGKTSAAIQLALNRDTEILSADSRQCYVEMNIGVARPTVTELAQVKHHFIACSFLVQEQSAATYEKWALPVLGQIFSSHDNAVLVGGTGLYIKALCEGLDEIPTIDKEVRKEILEAYEAYGLPWLQLELGRLDPEFLSGVESQNPHRLMRALEVVRTTGTSIRSFQKGVKAPRPFTVQKFGLELPREELYRRINERVDLMMTEGLLEEAENLYNDFVITAGSRSEIPVSLNTVGYSELFDHFRGLLSLQEAVDKIKQHTRNYAKRQLTWFHRDPQTEWMSPGEFSQRFRI